MSTPDFSKLPQWAQKHITNIQRERDVAIRELNTWVDYQTKSPVSIPEHVCTGESIGPSQKIRYIQTKRVEFEWKSIELRVRLDEEGILLQWSGIDHSNGEIALVPLSFQSVRLIHPKDMRI